MSTTNTIKSELSLEELYAKIQSIKEAENATAYDTLDHAGETCVKAITPVMWEGKQSSDKEGLQFTFGLDTQENLFNALLKGTGYYAVKQKKYTHIYKRV